MVVAAVLRSLMNGDCCFCTTNYKFVSLNPFYTPKNKEKRQELRRKEWNIWLSSTADDLDLVADWWFFWVTYNGERGGFSDQWTFLLCIFCCLGTVTWLLEIIQLSCVRPAQNWPWLPILILMVEDVPQMFITMVLNDRFSNMSSLSIFNLMTSLYSIMIRVAGEMFMNCCYCCERVVDEGENARSYSHLP